MDAAWEASRQVCLASVVVGTDRAHYVASEFVVFIVIFAHFPRFLSAVITSDELGVVWLRASWATVYFLIWFMLLDEGEEAFCMIEMLTSHSFE